jgi:hypothetical protein
MFGPSVFIAHKITIARITPECSSLNLLFDKYMVGGILVINIYIYIY